MMKEAKRKLEEYRRSLNEFREGYGGGVQIQPARFYLFGMGNRIKMRYEDGTLKEYPSGQILCQWKVIDEVILPPEYSVYLQTEEGIELCITEEEDGVWVIQSGRRERVPGTEAPLILPSFSDTPYPMVCRVLFMDILFNIVGGKPIPCYDVYTSAWYRDGAMIAMCLKQFGNLELIHDWILGLQSPYDRNRGPEVEEQDNLGQALYLISLVSDRSHPLVPLILEELEKHALTGESGLYVDGKCDGARHEAYITKWAKMGLRELGLEDPYTVPAAEDGYSALFWMDYQDTYTSHFDDVNGNWYPYLNWAIDHFHKVRNHCYISDCDYPLTWEGNPEKAPLTCPHAWHAAEALLYLTDRARG